MCSKFLRKLYEENVVEQIGRLAAITYILVTHRYKTTESMRWKR